MLDQICQIYFPFADPKTAQLNLKTMIWFMSVLWCKSELQINVNWAITFKWNKVSLNKDSFLLCGSIKSPGRTGEGMASCLPSLQWRWWSCWWWRQWLWPWWRIEKKRCIYFLPCVDVPPPDRPTCWDTGKKIVTWHFCFISHLYFFFLPECSSQVLSFCDLLLLPSGTFLRCPSQSTIEKWKWK